MKKFMALNSEDEIIKHAEQHIHQPSSSLQSEEQKILFLESLQTVAFREDDIARGCELCSLKILNRKEKSYQDAIRAMKQDWRKRQVFGRAPAQFHVQDLYIPGFTLACVLFL